VQQFKNSIPFHNESEKLTNEMETENNNPLPEIPVMTPVNPVVESPVIVLSPPIKHFASVPLRKFNQ